MRQRRELQLHVRQSRHVRISRSCQFVRAWNGHRYIAVCIAILTGQVWPIFSFGQDWPSRFYTRPSTPSYIPSHGSVIFLHSYAPRRTRAVFTISFFCTVSVSSKLLLRFGFSPAGKYFCLRLLQRPSCSQSYFSISRILRSSSATSR